MSQYYNRITVDDSNFIFLESGTFPLDYIGLEPALIYPTYFMDIIYPWKKNKDYSNSRYDNFNIGINIDNYQIQEYWEEIPDSIRQFGNKYATLPKGIFVSTFGRIYDYYSKTAIPTYIRKDGYLGVFNMMALHRIILYTFNPTDNFKQMTVDHKNMNVTDNCLWNLRWMSMYDNIQRSVELENRTNPYFKKGEANIHSTMTEYEAELCCKALLTHNYSYKQISKAIGITERQVKHIRDCDCHIDICNKYNMANNNYDYRHLKGQTDFVLPLLDVNQE